MIASGSHLYDYDSAEDLGPATDAQIAWIAADDQSRADNMATGEKVDDNAAGVFWIDAAGNPVHQSSVDRDRAVYIV
ncbi:hypothetical protein GYA93_15700 [Gordonia desulfuricans]|uniref:Uncharacterized protein n=1 Tax=Gordonia desulfuricans TaxID=89051 RepID=A0A7K3LSD2_9ACTN|nr:hypothetical protein [Gordonia desulfuricans]NDK91016.1 hypothetical protein [Gordonia desulfuricans]